MEATTGDRTDPGTARPRLEAEREALLRQLGPIERLLLESTTGGAAGPLRVPCRFCGMMIMSAATTCGFCWRALAPSAINRQA